MDLAKIITKLGFDRTDHMSAIVEGIPELKDFKIEIGALNLTEPVEAVKYYIDKWDVELGSHPKRRQVAEIGFALNKGHYNPSLLTLVESVREQMESILMEEGIDETVDIDAERKEKVYVRVARLIVHLIKGHILSPALKKLEELQSTIERQPAIFINPSISINSLSDDVDWLKAIENAGFNPVSTVKELEKEQTLVQSMINDFENRETPDRGRTIKDGIKRIEDKIKAEPDEHYLYEKDIFTIGYLFAIRGENPTVWSIVTQNRERIKTPDINAKYMYTFPGEGISNLPAKNFHKLIEGVLQGYASSYFLTYMEKELAKKDLPHPQSLTPDLMNALANNFKLKWNGQKNQVYDLFRNLKAEGYIDAPYDELAVWLKNNFDVFADTKVITIQRELSRAIKLPKGKRMDLKKMITPKSTP
jgi:hypothetical protein